MMMISVKHSVGLWADMRLHSHTVYLSNYSYPFLSIFTGEAAGSMDDSRHILIILDSLNTCNIQSSTTPHCFLLEYSQLNP